MIENHCSSGCKEQGTHATWGECVRSKDAAVMGLESTGPGFTAYKRHEKRLASYADARRQGIQPAGTQSSQVAQAVQISDRTGVAFGAAA